MDNRTAVIAVAGAFAIGAVGTNALADDDEGAERFDPVKVTQEDGRDDQRDDRRDDDRGSQGEPGRGDDDDVDVEPRDEDDDEGDGGNTHSGGTQDGAADNSGSVGNQATGGDSAVAIEAPAAAPAPAPAPHRPPSTRDGSDYGARSPQPVEPRVGNSHRDRVFLPSHATRSDYGDTCRRTEMGKSAHVAGFSTSGCPGRNRTFDAEIKSLSL